MMNRLKALSSNDTTYYNLPLDEELIDDGVGRLCLQESNTLYNVSRTALLGMLCGMPLSSSAASQLSLERFFNTPQLFDADLSYQEQARTRAGKIQADCLRRMWPMAAVRFI